MTLDIIAAGDSVGRLRAAEPAQIRFMVFPPTLLKNELLSKSMRRTLRAGFALKATRGGAFETLRASFPLIHARRVTSWYWGK